jgi:hypothetical protein
MKRSHLLWNKIMYNIIYLKLMLGFNTTFKWSFVFLLKYTLIFYYKWLNSNLQTNN